MKQNKLLILSLLASFLLLFSASYSTAQNAVTFGTVDDCPKPADATVTVPVLIDNDVDLAALDIIGQVVSDGNVDLIVTGISFDNRLDMAEVLDQRYPIGDLGGGIFRLGAVKMDGEDLVSGSGQVATLTLTYLSDCQLGTANLDPASVDCGGDPASTNFVDPDANQIDPTVNAGAVNVVNTPPTFTDCPGDAEIYWGDTYVHTMAADDPDLACGCDALTFAVEEGPGTINPASGLYTFTATGQHVGCQNIKIRVEDEFGGVAYCEFTISVLNEPPTFTECPECDTTYVYAWGTTVEVQTEAVDPDSGPSGLTYSLIPGTYPGNPEIDPATGLFTWVTQEDAAFIGYFDFCVIATDNANLDDCNLLNADTCCFTVKLDPKFRVSIEKVHDVLQGHYQDVSINLDGSYESIPMGGFDFLIAYDASAITFVEATPGAMLTACGWEYFTYRFGADGNCGNACPSGLLRLVAMAETNNGNNHPTCFTSAAGTELALINFFVSNDRTLECQYVPIYFYWMDCADNAISSRYGDTLFVEARVFAFEGFEGPEHEITDHAVELPSSTGIPDGCLLGDKLVPLRFVDFRAGGIDIVCSDSIDARGDINVNGLGYEIADAVMFTNYFISGLSAFGTHVEASIAASDVNADGITLSVSDLVYLIRVIQGDALPYAKPNPDERAVVSAQGGAISVDAPMNLGAALLTFEVSGEIGTPTLGVDMDMKYARSGNELRVLIFNIGSKAIPAGENLLVTIPGDVKLTGAEVASYDGFTVESTINRLPLTFNLAQNHPNPFNPTTTIELALPIASNYSVTIYNVAGQVIRTYSGYANAGVVSVEWDGRDASGSQVASGMYFYKAVASQFSATKKMLLMK